MDVDARWTSKAIEIEIFVDGVDTGLIGEVVEVRIS